MKLFMVTATGAEEFPLDLFVWANDAEQALAIWRKWLDDEVDEDNQDMEGEEPHVWEIPIKVPTVPCGLAWHDEVRNVTPV